MEAGASKARVTAFGINAYTGDTGENVVEKHDEERLGHEELYVVVSGRARFELDGSPSTHPAGTLVFLSEPAVGATPSRRSLGRRSAMIGGKPGVHETSAWEYFFAAYSHAGEGDFDRAIAEVNEGLAERPDSPPLRYHLACIESRAGRLDDARLHLERASSSTRVCTSGPMRTRTSPRSRSPPEA